MYPTWAWVPRGTQPDISPEEPAVHFIDSDMVHYDVIMRCLWRQEYVDNAGYSSLEHCKQRKRKETIGAWNINEYKYWNMKNRQKKRNGINKEGGILKRWKRFITRDCQIENKRIDKHTTISAGETETRRGTLNSLDAEHKDGELVFEDQHRFREEPY